MARQKEHPKGGPGYFWVVGWRVGFVQRQPDAGEWAALVASLNKAARDRHGTSRVGLCCGAFVVFTEQLAKDCHGILLSDSGTKRRYLMRNLRGSDSVNNIPR